MAVAPAAFGVPPGRYVYDVEGLASAGSPPMTRPFSGKSYLTVQPPTNGLQRSITTADGNSESSRTTDLFDPSGVYMTEYRISGGTTLAFVAEPPGALLVPLPPAGDWTWDLAQTGEPTNTIHGEYHYLGEVPTGIAGRTLSTWRIQGIRTIRFGTHSSTRLDVTQWIDPGTFLAVKMVSESVTFQDGHEVGRSRWTSSIESITPS